MYIDALFDSSKDVIHVVERVDGKRVYREYKPEYIFYYSDPRGKHRTIFDTPVTKVVANSNGEFKKEVSALSHKELWESDIRPINRCLSTNYFGKSAPKLHTVFFDIETAWCNTRGYAPTDDPFNPITAITLYLDWEDKLITLAIPPKTYSWDTAQEICNRFSDCFLFANESDMLSTFLDLIDDADCLSGWNSSKYDIPYTVNRVTKILSKNDTRKFCLWDKLPKATQFESYGGTINSFDLIGRIHIDYMDLYEKYVQEKKQSYALDSIGEVELGERKVAYEGSLDKLYNTDFEKFLDYNRQDVMLLKNLDKKLNYLDIANQVAHDTTVLIPATLGTVAVTEQAIVNKAHSKGLIVPNKKKAAPSFNNDEENADGAVGAYVANPVKGLHEYVGAIDINSLYPSTIRALNMGLETIVGQVRPIKTDAYIASKMAESKRMTFAAAWEGLFGTLEYTDIMNQTSSPITIDWEESGESTTHTASEVWDMVFSSNNKWMLSANGTIFTYARKGVIPEILEEWYTERKALQKRQKEATDIVEIAHWNKLQTAKKLILNSSYGALLNAGCRFYDKRMGQSTTLSGRVITKHMTAKVNELITGTYNHTGDAICYGDTDSVSADSNIETNIGTLTIEALFNRCSNYYNEGDKEYACDLDIKVKSYDPGADVDYFGNINYIYRHKVSKAQWEIEDEDGNVIKITNDHSVMVERDGNLIEVKPAELLETDILITMVVNGIKRARIKSIKQLDDFKDEYVYDIGMKNENHAWFFANNILVHNSVYFTAYSVLKAEIDSGEIEWSKDIAVQLYDNIADQVNDSFPEMMERSFHCPRENGQLIKGGRELVARKGLFITKKRYGVLIYDLEGSRLDLLNEKDAIKKGVLPGDGKLKAMGLDLKRSDTPIVVQDHLKELLIDVLTDVPKETIIAKAVAFKEDFRQLPAWKKGTPKRVNNLTKFTKANEEKKTNTPGHVRGAINYNKLKQLNHDNYSMSIVDGQKTIMCYLKPNPLGYTSVNYPTDENNLPQWFKDLPFDEVLMEETIVDKKIANLLGVLNWNIEEAISSRNSIGSLFDFV